MRGPVNVVAPQAVRNAEFTKALGRVMRRPAFLPLPALAVRLLFGEMGEALLLASTRTMPSVLLQSGYTFRHPELEGALEAVLSKNP
jgi:NAD dependent epimerase/dehydratase family enzyme